MKRNTILGTAALLGALVLGAVSADAASLMSPGAAPAVGSPVENAAWACGPARCNWVPGPARGPIPPYARGWGPPRRPGCYWVARKPNPWAPPRWVMVCR